MQVGFHINRIMCYILPSERGSQILDQDVVSVYIKFVYVKNMDTHCILYYNLVLNQDLVYSSCKTADGRWNRQDFSRQLEENCFLLCCLFFSAESL